MSRPLELGHATAQRKRRMINDEVVDLGSAWSSYKVSRLAERQNMLVNWHLANPVNQRGQQIYPGGMWQHLTVDMWKRSTHHSQVSVHDGFVKFSHAASGTTLFQFLEFFRGLAGKTVTMSIIARSGNIPSQFFLSMWQPGIAYFPGDMAAVWVPLTDEFELYTNTVVLPASFSNENVHLAFAIAGGGRQNAGFEIDIQAVKLEAGTVSTLANDPPPDFGLELAKCRRFQVRNGTGITRRVRCAHANGNQMFFDISLPQTLRIHPNIVMLDNAAIEVWSGSPASLQTNFAFSAQTAHGSAVIVATKANHGLADGMLWYSHILFDANL